MSRRHPFLELFFARLREFRREPEVIFWVFGFPIVLAIGLGIAFRDKAPDEIAVGVIDVPVVAGAPGASVAIGNPGADELVRALPKSDNFDARKMTSDEAAQALRLGKIALAVTPGAEYDYRFDPTRPDSLLARARVHDALERARGRVDPVKASETLVTEPGARYIDFLIPGLLGMNIMGGGMWGVGFVIVDMRSRKLLKRLVATPMRKSHFLAAMLASRMLLVFGEMLLLLFFGWLVFGLVMKGALWQVALMTLLGAFAFAGLGLLVASRAQKVETVSGLINLVMVPMFVFSGIFFSSERFPGVIQPFVKALPLTVLNDGLRAVILEGASLSSQLLRIGVLLVWGVGTFAVAMRAFRWT